MSNTEIFSTESDLDLNLDDITGPSEPPGLQEDIFLDERKNLQTQARSLFDEAALLRQQLTTLTDRQMRLTAGGALPAFDANDEVLTWLKALPETIFRSPLPIAGTVLEQAVERAGAKFGPQIVSLGAGMCDVLMRLRTADFSPRQLRALGLRQGGVLTLTVHFDPAYHRAAKPPALTIEYSAPNGLPQVATSAVTDAKHHFRLGYQMLNILMRHLQQAWATGASENVLVDVLTLASKRIATLPQHCVACDERIKATQLRPTTCGSTPCVNQAETWGCGFEPQDIAQNPEVADLLISLTLAAAAGGREAYFKRVPAVFRTAGKIDFKYLAEEIDRLPALKTLVSSDDMIASLESVSPTAVATLSWLMVSNEGYLEFIPKHQQFPGMQTPYQFRIFGGPMEREIAFQARPAQQCNRFGFHGSGFSNWHSILRTGLVVGGSNNGFDFHGAAYGKGIYLSNHAFTSLGYCLGSPQGWTHSRFGNNPRCLALCETNGRSRLGGDSRTLGDTEVFPDADAVALRYLFVYPSMNATSTATAEQAARFLRQHMSDGDKSPYIKTAGR